MLDRKIRVINDKEFDQDLDEMELVDTPDNFFEEINAIDILEQSKNENSIGLLCSKIQNGGKLILNGLDFVQLCGRVFYGRMPLKDMSEYTKGINNFLSLPIILQYLLDNRWKIDFAGVKECRYLVEATKP